MAHYLLFSKSVRARNGVPANEWATSLGQLFEEADPFETLLLSQQLNGHAAFVQARSNMSSLFSILNARNRGFRISSFPHWLLFLKNCTVSAAGVNTRRSR